MFYVQNAYNVDCFRTEDYEAAKRVALQMKDKCAENFSIVEVKQVWTTQTLDEALKDDGGAAFDVMSSIDADFSDTFKS